MNKTINTVLFIIAASVVLSLLILGTFFGLLFLTTIIFPELDASIRSIIIMLNFVLSFLGGLLFYNFLIKVVIKKFNLEKYLLTKKNK